MYYESTQSSESCATPLNLDVERPSILTNDLHALGQTPLQADVWQMAGLGLCPTEIKNEY
jgi:hypothetical protein